MKTKRQLAAEERQIAAAVVKLDGQRRQAEELWRSAPAVVRRACLNATATEEQANGYCETWARRPALSAEGCTPD